jgi:hypothetical protein
VAESEPARFPVSDLLRAVRAEISAALNDDAGSGDKVVLHDGRRHGTNEYVFSCKAWKQSLSGKDLLIKRTRSRVAWEKAEAAPMPGGSIRVVTEADLGATVPSATLTEDDTVGLEKLAERLEGTTEPNDSFHAATATGLSTSANVAPSSRPCPVRQPSSGARPARARPRWWAA